MIRKKLIGPLDSRKITLTTLYLSLACPAKCWVWTRVGVLGCLTHSSGNALLLVGTSTASSQSLGLLKGILGGPDLSSASQSQST